MNEILADYRGSGRFDLHIRDHKVTVDEPVTVNLLINVVWWMTGPRSFYWPAFPLLLWGIGIVMHAWDAYRPAMPSEVQIEKEIRRIRR